MDDIIVKRNLFCWTAVTLTSRLCSIVAGLKSIEIIKNAYFLHSFIRFGSIKYRHDCGRMPIQIFHHFWTTVQYRLSYLWCDINIILYCEGSITNLKRLVNKHLCIYIFYKLEVHSTFYFHFIWNLNYYLKHTKSSSN